MSARIAELVIHGWAIRSQLESVAHLSAAALPVLSDWVGQSATSLLGLIDFRLSHPIAEPVRYRFDLSAKDTCGYDLVVENDNCRMEPAGTDSPNVTYHFDVETFVLMGFGRFKFGVLINEGQLAVEGDLSLVDALRKWFEDS